LEDHGRRRFLGSALRQAEHLLDWRHCGFGLRSQCNLRGHRRSLHSRQYLFRRWRVSFERRGQNLEKRHIGKVIVNPTNPDIAFVAALGHAYGANTERGIFRTLDGGKKWEKVLYLDDRTGGIDIVFDPQNSHVLFAAMWEGYRTPWTLNSGGDKDGLYRSNDDGTTWKRVEGNGMPEGPLGKIGVAVSGADSNVVYALIEAKKGGLYRSDDGGTNWTLINDDHRFRQRAWYFTHVWADPKDSNKVYIANTGLFRSNDGGKSFERFNAPHGDHHGLWIDPHNPNRLINGNDGGATISIDGGKNWSTQMNQPTAQFYHVTADNDFPYRVYGTQQDNSSVGIATASDRGYIDRGDWEAVGGGESGYVAVDPRDSHIVYAGSYFGYISRLDRRTNQVQNIQQWPLDPDGYNAAVQKYRYTWTMPIVFSPHDPNILYHSSQFLFVLKMAVIPGKPSAGTSLAMTRRNSRTPAARSRRIRPASSSTT
jgi:photosystem II stability/assembly factor-like uncharacterized protein